MPAEHSPIPFVTKLPTDQAEDWLARLRQVLPEEQVVWPNTLTEEARASVRLAIVANPEPSVLEGYPALEWVQSLWAGVEGLVDALPERAAIVRMTDPRLAEAMAEAVLAWTLYLHRGMPHYAAAQARGEWSPLRYRRPQTRQVTILGAGKLGSLAAARLRENGFRVSTFRRGVELDPLLATTDILVVLLPLTEQTRGLIGAHELAKLPAGASLINFARGPILDDAALLAALGNGHLEHAVLDVFDEEPLPADSPLWRHPRVTVLPHISANTDYDTAAQIVADNIEHWRTWGELPQTVDRSRGY